MQTYNNPNTSGNKTEERRQQDASNFARMVQMLGMARQMDGQTMLGFALGKLLRGAYDHYKDARDEEKARELAKKDPLRFSRNPDGSLMSPEQIQQRNARWRNAMNFFGMDDLYQTVDKNQYNGGRTPYQDAANYLTRMALDPTYAAQEKNRYPSQASGGTSSLQNYIDHNRVPDVRQTAADALLPVPNVQTTVTKNKESFTNADGKTTSHQNATATVTRPVTANPNDWDTTQKGTTGQQNIADLFKDGLSTSKWKGADYMNLFGR